jgi:nitrogen regulatory protein PII
MNQMIIFVLNDLDKSADLLEAWEAAGARGITCINTTGLGNIRHSAEIADLPFYLSLTDILKSQQHHHCTFFTVVDNDNVLEKLIEAAQNVTGGLDKPNTGFLFTVPVSSVYGMSSDNSITNTNK